MKLKFRLTISRLELSKRYSIQGQYKRYETELQKRKKIRETCGSFQNNYDLIKL